MNADRPAATKQGEAKASTGRLGLIATGQSPRNDYLEFHRGLLRALGVEVDVVLKCMLDGLTTDQIAALAPGDGDEAIHGYMRSEGSTNKRFGSGWGEVWMKRSSTIALVQARIDELEREGVNAVIYCCAEPYPDGAFKASRHFVLPADILLKYAEQMAAYRERAKIGILTSGTRQRPQQLEAWRRQPWASRVELRFEVLGDGPVDAARRLAAFQPDLVLYQGYGIGLAPGDRTDVIAQMEAALQQPIVTAHVASTLFVRNFLMPSIDGPRFVSRIDRTGS